MKGFYLQISVAAMLSLAATSFLPAQNPLAIPPLLSGDTIDLDVQIGTQSFYPGTSTPTYGINGPWMAPTIAVNKGDTVMLNVINHINTSTTMHWHGLHVAPHDDGGPHQAIAANTTWSPRFEIKNDAATYWYHPHGEGRTERHVSKGLAGFFLVHDSVEANLGLPLRYGVDDFPIVVQSKAFDILQQIAVATNSDTALFVNGTLNPYLDAPAQVVRLRLLNGSSMRSYLFGFDGNRPFQLIAGDGGLLDTALTLTRIRISPGERYDILVDLSGLQGQTLMLRNYGLELPNDIYGARRVGVGASVMTDYQSNPLNGANYDVLQINVVAPTANPILTMPVALAPAHPIDTTTLNAVRTIHLEPMFPTDSTTLVEGPFGINGVQFNIDSINLVTYLGHTERWHLVNTTLIAHPFHIHDVQFDVVAVNGGPVPPFMQGKKDVVLVMPGQSVDFVTRFEDFADPMVPYMYHCHLLHHEDEGMMGSFLVMDTVMMAAPPAVSGTLQLSAFPNPTTDWVHLRYAGKAPITNYSVVNALGQSMDVPTLRAKSDLVEWELDMHEWASGIYFLRVQAGKDWGTVRLVKE